MLKSLSFSFFADLNIDPIRDLKSLSDPNRESFDPLHH